MLTKIKSATALSKILDRLRAKGKKVVFTNGCFDIMHPGHVVYLDRAKKLGDVLVIGLNSDASVRKLKGPDRPVNSRQARAIVLAALSCVDYVAVFGESTPERLIRMLKPAVLVKGGDWKGKEIAGADFVRSCGGRVATIPFVKGFSTTAIIKKISR